MRKRTSLRIASLILSFSLIALYVMYYSRTGVFAGAKPAEDKQVMSGTKSARVKIDSPTTQTSQPVAPERTILIFGSKAPGNVVHPGETARIFSDDKPATAPATQKVTTAATTRSIILGGSKSREVVSPQSLNQGVQKK